MRRAFTLLEVLLALAIFMALLTAMTQFTNTVASSRARVLDRADRQHVVDAIIDRIELMLMTGAASSGGEAGLVGDNDSLEVQVAQDRPGEQPLVARRGVSVAFNRPDGQIRFNEGQPLGLGDLRLRYFDGDTWLDRFDSVESDGLPRAVVLEAWFDAVNVNDAGDRTRLPDRRRVFTSPGTWRRRP
jgi:prepilin-type N-terminal cleavage/methylation domain-containing protein